MPSPGSFVERIAWTQIRSQLESGLALELRLCLETLWALPGPDTPFAVTLLPSSVLVGPDGTVELGVPDPADQRYFRRYLAPELVRGEAATLSSATYAVGALLFEAVSGAPFRSSDCVELELGYRAARAQATGLGPDAADTGLLQIAARATQPNPDERWATPEAFSRELDRSARHRTASREELARRVHRCLRRRGPSRAHTDPKLASELVMPFTTLDGQTVTRERTATVPRADALRTTTLRGFSLDLSSYPPPRPQSAPAVAPDPTPAAPEGRVRPSTSTVRRAAEGRPVALITALVVAVPLVAMTLWNWRSSARAAARNAPTAHEPLPVAPNQGALGLHPALALPAPRPIAAAPPSSAAPPPPPVAEPARVRRAAKRPSAFKPREPFDYGI